MIANLIQSVLRIRLHNCCSKLDDRKERGTGYSQVYDSHKCNPVMPAPYSPFAPSHLTNHGLARHMDLVTWIY